MQHLLFVIIPALCITITTNTMFSVHSARQATRVLSSAGSWQITPTDIEFYATKKKLLRKNIRRTSHLLEQSHIDHTKRAQLSRAVIFTHSAAGVSVTSGITPGAIDIYSHLSTGYLHTGSYAMDLLLLSGGTLGAIGCAIRSGHLERQRQSIPNHNIEALENHLKFARAILAEVEKTEEHK